jgi:hypothetical protein
MKKFLLLSCSFIFSLSAFAQASLSDDQLFSAAMQEGKTPAEAAAFVQYYHAKQNLQPSQRNSNPVAPQLFTNPGFETGDFTGWNGAIGDNNLSSQGPLQNIQTGIFSSVPNDALSNSNARHTIISSAFGNDPTGGFPTVPAGSGNYTVRLGGTTPNYQGEILEQTWTVDQGQPYILVSYAAVLHNGGHTAAWSPYFKYELLDVNNQPVATQYLTWSSPGFLQSSLDTTVHFLPWATDSIDLTAYAGTTMTLRYTVAGCTQSGHFGYCYVDAFYPFGTSVNENTTASFSVFPNPAKNYFTVNLSHTPAEDEFVFVTNMLGQKTEAEISQSEIGWKVNASALKPGMYLIHVCASSSETVQKVIVQ